MLFRSKLLWRRDFNKTDHFNQLLSRSFKLAPSDVEDQRKSLVKLEAY